MLLRKVLTIGAVAVLAAGLLSLTPAATATTPTGAAPVYIGVNDSTIAGSVGIDGTFKSGNASFGGYTYGCFGGNVVGTVARGPVSAAPTPDMSFSTLNVTCETPLGDASIVLQANCSVTLKFPDTATAKDPWPTNPNIHDGTVDTSALPIPGTSKLNVVRGAATMPATPSPGCVKIRVLGTTCTAYVVATGPNTIPAYWDESIRTVGGVKSQDLILDGPGTLTGASAGCAGLLTGTFTLNQIRYRIQVTSGTTTGIDFRLTPSVPPPGPPYNGVNGSTAVGIVPIDGVFKSGSAAFGGSSYGCTGGTVAGNIERGPFTTTQDMSFDTLSITCSTPAGNASFTLNAGCLVTADFAIESNVHDRTVVVDTGPIPVPAGASVNVVRGVATMPAGCVTVTVIGGFCTAKVTGTVNAYFDEAITTVGGVNYQDLILNGVGLTLNNASAGCFGLLTGGATLNAIDFNVKVTGGTTTGIDFRLNP